MGKRVSQLEELTTVANVDEVYIVDKDDISQSPEGSSKKANKGNLLKEYYNKSEIESLIASMIAESHDLMHPVGSVYINIEDNTNPATLFGFGTWELTSVGRALVGYDAGDSDFNEVGKTGGAKTHTLSVAELASHAHKVSRGINMTGFATPYGAPISGWGLQPEGEASSGAYYRDTNTNGSGNAHNNLQPYIVVYMWKRTA